MLLTQEYFELSFKILYLNSPGELPPDPTGEELHELLVVHVQQLYIGNFQDVDITYGKKGIIDLLFISQTKD